MTRPDTDSLSIGELSRRTAVPVKTLRFYSDEGLLPPRGRTASGYRVYGEDAVVRLDLIRTLREAGLGLDRIRAVLARELSLADALRLQLRAVEAHLASLKHVASALRAALRSEPTEHDIRRLCAVTRLSNEERRAVIEGFYDKVAEGSAMDANWKRTMIDASAPVLPDEPTPEQLDAWIELTEIVQDPSFLETMKKGVQRTWTPEFDHHAYKRTADAMVAEARDAIARGLGPESDEARQIVDRCVVGFAAAMQQQPDAAFRRSLRDRHAQQDPRALRYWQLVGVLKGRPPTPDEWPAAEWQWFIAASKHHAP